MIETKIEIGERSKTTMSYNDAVLYVFCLGDGWRLPTQEEYYDEYHRINSSCWTLNERSSATWYVTPVRDLKDD